MKILFNSSLVYFVLTLAISSPCFSKWKKLEVGDEYVKYYDIDTVKKIDGIVHIWRRLLGIFDDIFSLFHVGYVFGILGDWYIVVIGGYFGKDRVDERLHFGGGILLYGMIYGFGIIFRTDGVGFGL